MSKYEAQTQTTPENKIIRTLSRDKVPKPNFAYDNFYDWLKEPHRKFTIEIGCGVGYHPILWAKNNPNSKILAIERTREKFDKFSSRLLNHKHLNNIFATHADAGVLLPHLDVSNLVDEYFVLYPNPYPKNKHSNLRFSFSPLTLFMIDSIKIGGQITFATNIQNYAEELRTEVPKLGKIKLVSDNKIVPNASEHIPRSHFETKYLSRNETCYNLIFQRLAQL